MALGTVGGDNDQVQVVLEPVAGGIGPHESDLECRTQASRTDARRGTIRAGRLRGDVYGECILVALVQRTTFTETPIRVWTGEMTTASSLCQSRNCC
jgi:hypothetical protein